MQLNVKLLKREGYVEFKNTVSLPRVAAEVVDVAAMDPVDVAGNASWAEPLATVEGTLTTQVTYLCSRCLSPFEKPLRTRFLDVYTADQTRLDDEMLPLPSDVLDLSAALEEAVFLALDERPLCQADCQGLCPECGCNRNQETCNCDTRTIDPRLAELKDLLSDDHSE